MMSSRETPSDPSHHLLEPGLGVSISDPKGRIILFSRRLRNVAYLGSSEWVPGVIAGARAAFCKDGVVTPRDDQS